ncbi:flavin-containing monooxygenase [Alkalihalobacillus sp. 1P02AB]|uniref:flavin-containing monooxygenase n=1 Tax=Alkalihalobacillus sp. 1P02AB TaxID=3132260 RepID=UPI0039A74C62
MLNKYKTIIIGAGQAGLTMGYHLQLKNESFLIIDGHQNVGDSWRFRYDSLQLFTPRSHSSLPGLKMKGDPSGYPDKDELADYLQEYQQNFNLNVEMGTKVISVVKVHDEFLINTNNNQEFCCSNVIIATGPFQVPFIPEFHKKLPSSIYQMHTEDYKNPSSLQEGDVLIVGGGNSGMQIAVELVNNDKEVHLSLGKKPKFFPYQVLGKSIFWWLSVLGVMRFTIRSKIGQKIKKNDPIIGKEIKPLIRNGRIDILGRATDVSGNTVYFANNKSIMPSNIIWATGYKNDYSWIQPSADNVFSSNGLPNHKRGVTSEKGLYFIGLSWQYRRGSALLLGVGEDAQFIANQVTGGNRT